MTDSMTFVDEMSSILFNVISIKILKIIFAFVIVMGIVGNALNIIVFFKKTMRNFLIFKIMLGLSLIDLVILLLCACETYLEVFNSFVLRDSSLLLCKLDTFLVYFLTQTRNLFSMAITIQRAKVILKIYKKKTKKILFFSIPNS